MFQLHLKDKEQHQHYRHHTTTTPFGLTSPCRCNVPPYHAQIELVRMTRTTSILAEKGHVPNQEGPRAAFTAFMSSMFAAATAHGTSATRAFDAQAVAAPSVASITSIKSGAPSSDHGQRTSTPSQSGASSSALSPPLDKRSSSAISFSAPAEAQARSSGSSSQPSPAKKSWGKRSDTGTGRGQNMIQKALNAVTPTKKRMDKKDEN
ncbi:hypothetical protein EMPS_07786 [Entomortierella parvispora]|uniref:Uncharacterized protein n=1 Tax=Entomortierella parvispora TaxID=205924 RepID=A0A9P3LYS2_9FUNG|nr:hypothetical protein EMPS_07786 [Entomortierella parvispora]